MTLTAQSTLKTEPSRSRRRQLRRGRDDHMIRRKGVSITGYANTGGILRNCLDRRIENQAISKTLAHEMSDLPRAATELVLLGSPHVHRS